MIGLISTLIVVSFFVVLGAKAIVCFARRREVIGHTISTLAEARFYSGRRLSFLGTRRPDSSARGSTDWSAGPPQPWPNFQLSRRLWYRLLAPVSAVAVLLLTILNITPFLALAESTDNTSLNPTASSEVNKGGLIPLQLANAITGTVFRDFNANGARDTGEPGVGEITVTAYADTGAVVATVTTDATGAYTLTVAPGSTVRVEFTGWPGYLQPGPGGPDSGTTVLFATEGNTNVNVGLLNPAEYCQTNPTLATPLYINGDPLLGGTTANRDVLVSFTYNLSGTSPPPVRLALASQIGATWGLAYQRSSSTLFAAALMKRHVGFGPLGPGGIYAIDTSNGNVSLFLDLATLGIPVGTDPRTLPGDPGLPADMNTPNRDPNAWDPVGKISLGDIDISEDEQTLWVVSLNNRTLYEIPIANPNTFVAHPIPNPGCSNGDYRPWAVAVHDGLVYVGIVCSAETSQNQSDLHAYVMAHDPAGAVGNFTSVFDFPLDFARGCVSNASTGCYDAQWRPWISTMTSLYRSSSLAFGKQVIYPQPILSDIEFDETGAMILGFIDRLGHQVGNGNYSTGGIPIFVSLDGSTLTITDTNFLYEGAMAGDILRACRTTTGWEIEGSGSCPQPPGGAGNNQGPNGGEFYFEDRFFVVPSGNNTHDQTTMGGLALLPGSGEIVTNMFDPIQDPITNVFRAAGVGWFNNGGPEAGRRSRSYQVFESDAFGKPATFGKAAGLGELELLCNAAPIQIGHRVWNDTNGNGIQDAGEVPIAGVVVGLYDGAGNLITTATTDAQGLAFFNNLNPNTGYQIQILPSNFNPGGPLAGFTPTTPNVDSDLHDSDGIDIGGGTTGANFTTGNAGANNHTVDFGFIVSTPPQPPPSPPPPADGGEDDEGGAPPPTPTPVATPAEVAAAEFAVPQATSTVFPVSLLPETGIGPPSSAAPWYWLVALPILALLAGWMIRRHHK